MQKTLENIAEFHKKTFPRATVEIQEQKCLQEIAEFQTTVNLAEKIEEAVDIIISMIGFISKCGFEPSEEVDKKMRIIEKREYDYNDFDHIEPSEEEKLIDEW